MAEQFFAAYQPTKEADMEKWSMTLSKIFAMFSDSYADKENLELLFRKLMTQNFTEFLCYSDLIFTDLSVEELVSHQKICRNRETEYWTYTTLKKELHFLDKLIEALLPKPLLVDNPHYKSSPPMKLYRKKAVKKAMETEENRQHLEKYVKNSAKREQTRALKKEKEKQIRIAREEKWNESLTRLAVQDYYPAARAMHRHFILHLGPTNSGKTYEALEDFRNHADSVYLAPLRLLAQEVAEDTNEKGTPCSMETGEERSIVDGAATGHRRLNCSIWTRPMKWR